MTGPGFVGKQGSGLEVSSRVWTECLRLQLGPLCPTLHQPHLEGWVLTGESSFKEKICT